MPRKGASPEGEEVGGVSGGDMFIRGRGGTSGGAGGGPPPFVFPTPPSVKLPLYIP